MKSKVYFVPALISGAKKFIRSTAEDKLTFHAAEASFFTITSAVPFISLLLALIGIFLPRDFSSEQINRKTNEILSLLSAEIVSAPNLSLISLSAVTALWSASRGVGAVRGGIEAIYKSKRGSNFFIRRIKSLVSTVIFIALLTSVASLLLFGDLVMQFFGEDAARLISPLRTPMFILVVAILFTCVYVSVAKRSETVRHGFIYHVPGAIFSSAGWVVFSYFYSLYISNFPNASYIYGSLAAICLIMLWVYFCMIILFLGAEINKMLFCRKKYAKQGDA